MTIKVFVENEAGSNIKNLYDEKTLKYQGNVTVSRSYPYPYGFILNTTSGDGDNVDCYILTDQPLKTGEIIKCEPIGLMKQLEDNEEDHNILAVMKGEKAVVDESVRYELRNFVSHVFEHIEGKTVVAGDFLGKEEALQYIQKCTD